ncbi:putative secreted protein [Deinobacterium chartae]|uniref:Putative secreted protein n=1 Tax=Deinobacterium chartae TaxID=521158 RepID=A0A841I0E8_9DEIO|nr:DUF2259 domain-containing protein [Deinobacterium chartae]MBB6097920.1 putative secreted protein [Deinobacterium chartae]
MRTLATLFALLASLALAADLPSVRSLGFAPGGRYYAFEAYGHYDGSGFPFSAYHVVDVDRNAYVARLERGGQDWAQRSLQAVRAQTAREIAPVLARYRISGQQPGLRVYRQLPSPFADQPPGLQRVRASVRGQGLEVRLTPTSVPAAPCTFPETEMIPPGHTVRGLHLSAGGRTLQRDAQLPRWRNCAFGYRLEEVRVYGDRVAVLLRVYLPGFEGADRLPMVVTGRWR